MIIRFRLERDQGSIKRTPFPFLHYVISDLPPGEHKLNYEFSIFNVHCSRRNKMASKTLKVDTLEHMTPFEQTGLRSFLSDGPDHLI